MVAWLVAAEPGSGNQKLVFPTSTALVWSVQPVWSDGQERVNWLPETAAVMLVGVVLTEVLTSCVPVAGTMNGSASEGRGRTRGNRARAGEGKRTNVD